MDIIELSKAEIRNILLVGTHLHKFQGKNRLSIPEIISAQGMVQYDPLNPAGRYHDHFFFSRIEHYTQGDFEKIAYKKKLIFEYYNPNLCALSIEYFPIFWPLMEERILGAYYQTRIEKVKSIQPGILDDVYNFVKENGVTMGKDLAHLGKAHKEFASWKSNQTSSSVLEYLWVMGKLAVIERTEQFQKKYNTIEKYIPKKYQIKSTEPVARLKYQKFLLMQKSYPVINAKKVVKNGDSISFGKTSVVPSVDKDCEDFHIAKIKETNKNVIIPANYSDLMSVEPYDENLRLIGVLDPLIWDRELLRNIFDFEYTWEVYKKEKDRIWGYYVFPLLYKGRFIGRMEVKTTEGKDSKNLKIFNLTLQSSTKLTPEVKQAFKYLDDRLLELTGVKKILKDSSFRKINK